MSAVAEIRGIFNMDYIKLNKLVHLSESLCNIDICTIKKKLLCLWQFLNHNVHTYSKKEVNAHFIKIHKDTN